MFSLFLSDLSEFMDLWSRVLSGLQNSIFYTILPSPVSSSDTVVQSPYLNLQKGHDKERSCDSESEPLYVFGAPS